MEPPGTDAHLWGLVGAQAAALAGLAWPGRPRWSLRPAVTVSAATAAAAGAAVALAAGARLGEDLTPIAEPRVGARLHTDGLYRFSRHPLYAGLLVSAAGVAVLRRRREPLMALAALAGVLHVKAGVEEARLRRRFGDDYETYAARTGRLLPRLRPSVPAPASRLADDGGPS